MRDARTSGLVRHVWPLLLWPLQLLLLILSSTPSSSASYELVILHTNDVHARFEMSTNRGASCKTTKKSKCYGGVARRAGFIEEVRRKNRNVLLLDAGDQFQGTPWFFTYKGTAASYFMNVLKYDAMCLGNHEFDNGVEGLRQFFRNITFPVLCSNLVIDKEVSPFLKYKLKKHIVVEVGGRKIGLIGYITHKVPSLSKTETLKFRKEVDTIREEAEELTKQGVNIIIAIGHAGLLVDLDLAKKLTNVDIIIGGHSHSLLFNGKNPNGDGVAGKYPVEVMKSSGTPVLVVQAGSFGKYVGYLKVNFDNNGRVTFWFGNPVLMDSSIPENQEIKEDIELLNKKVKQTFEKVMGSAGMDFDTSDNICRVKECEMGNMYADAMVEFTKKKKEWRVHMALVNGGSFRASITEGEITYGDAISVFPFNNDLVIVTMNGSLLKEVFEHSVRDFSLLDRAGKYLQVSGVKVEYDFNAKRQVKSIKLKKSWNSYQYIKPSDEYKIIIPSYLAEGGDGYSVFKKVSNTILNIDILDVDVFLEYLKKNSPITSIIQCRIEGMETFDGWSELFRLDEKCCTGRCSTASVVSVVLVAAVALLHLL